MGNSKHILGGSYPACDMKHCAACIHLLLADIRGKIAYCFRTPSAFSSRGIKCSWNVKHKDKIVPISPPMHQCRTRRHLLYPHAMAYDAAMDPLLLPTSIQVTTPYTMRFRMFKLYVWACTNTASNDMYSYSKAFGTPHIRNKTTNQNLNVRST